MVRKITSVETRTLKEAAIALVDDTSGESIPSLDAVLAVLMGRMPQKEYIEFCNNL